MWALRINLLHYHAQVDRERVRCARLCRGFNTARCRALPYPARFFGGACWSCLILASSAAVTLLSSGRCRPSSAICPPSPRSFVKNFMSCESIITPGGPPRALIPRPPSSACQFVSGAARLPLLNSPCIQMNLICENLNSSCRSRRITAGMSANHVLRIVS